MKKNRNEHINIKKLDIKKTLLSFNIFLFFVFIFRIIIDRNKFTDIVPTFTAILLSVNISFLIIYNLIIKKNSNDDGIKSNIRLIVLSAPLVVLLGILFFNIFIKVM
ncbi:hypothetical protein [Helcococcus ovis]|uniref:hypothetical protein n=1 Tax=Helcococcus ovis TaxID=72026 RepID=UPI0038B9BE76